MIPIVLIFSSFWRFSKRFLDVLRNLGFCIVPCGCGPPLKRRDSLATFVFRTHLFYWNWWSFWTDELFENSMMALFHGLLPALLCHLREWVVLWKTIRHLVSPQVIVIIFMRWVPQDYISAEVLHLRFGGGDGEDGGYDSSGIVFAFLVCFGFFAWNLCRRGEPTCSRDFLETEDVAWVIGFFTRFVDSHHDSCL